MGEMSRFHVVRLDAVSAGLRSEIASVWVLPSTSFLNGKTDVERSYRVFEKKYGIYHMQNAHNYTCYMYCRTYA